MLNRFSLSSIKKEKLLDVIDSGRQGEGGLDIHWLWGPFVFPVPFVRLISDDTDEISVNGPLFEGRKGSRGKRVNHLLLVRSYLYVLY